MRIASNNQWKNDFNDVMESPCLKAALKRGWIEAHDLSEEPPDETRGHHFCFSSGFSHDEPGNFSETIYHIIVFGKNNPTVLRFKRHAPIYFDKFSDLFPLYVDIIL